MRLLDSHPYFWIIWLRIWNIMVHYAWRSQLYIHIASHYHGIIYITWHYILHYILDYRLWHIFLIYVHSLDFTTCCGSFLSYSHTDVKRHRAALKCWIAPSSIYLVYYSHIPDVVFIFYCSISPCVAILSLYLWLVYV